MFSIFLKQNKGIYIPGADQAGVCPKPTTVVEPTVTAIASDLDSPKSEILQVFLHELMQFYIFSWCLHVTQILLIVIVTQR